MFGNERCGDLKVLASDRLWNMVPSGVGAIKGSLRNYTFLQDMSLGVAFVFFNP